MLPLMPVTQSREQKDGRHAGQSANDKENAVGVNEAVRRTEPFDRSARKPLQDLSQPSIRRTQECILCGRVSQTGEARHVRYKRNSGEAETEIVTRHDAGEETNAQARERESRK